MSENPNQEDDSVMRGELCRLSDASVTPKDVVLVAAPFLSVLRPALGISTLKSALSARGVTVEIDYLNTEFAELLGVDFYELVSERLPTQLLLGEWIFAASVNTPDRERDIAYLQLIKQSAPFIPLEKLYEARELAGQFVAVAASRIASRNPKLVGFSTVFQQNCPSLAIAGELKRMHPSVLVCFGGANCEGGMGRAILSEFPQVDCVFSGEADTTFPEFVVRFLARREICSHPAIFCRHANSELRDNGIVTLDNVPIPDFCDYFEALGRRSYRRRVQPSLMFESSRGCWWGEKHHCTFCGLNGEIMAHRTKSPGRIMQELDALSERWGLTSFQSADNILTMSHIKDVFAPLAERRSPFRFFYEIKGELVV